MQAVLHACRRVQPRTLRLCAGKAFGWQELQHQVLHLGLCALPRIRRQPPRRLCRACSKLRTTGVPWTSLLCIYHLSILRSRSLGRLTFIAAIC